MSQTSLLEHRVDRALFERSKVREDMSLRDALERLIETGLQILLITGENGSLDGVLTDGDIRRALLGNLSLDIPVGQIMNRKCTTLCRSEASRALDLIRHNQFNHVPIVDEEGRVVDLVLGSISRLGVGAPARDMPVVIMAGGKGTRLSPLTRIVPKPLMPVGDQTMLEKIMDTFGAQGFHNFKVIVNYKRELIKSYFSETASPYSIEFLDEEDFLGTAGGVRLLRGVVDGPFILSNCDIVAELNYSGLLEWHREHDAHLTILGVRKRVDIPYGVIKVDGSSFVTEIKEKPFYNHVIVSGVYVIDAAVLEVIPEGAVLGMDGLIRMLIERNMKVTCYPIETGWFDMGQFEEYRNLLKHFGVFDV